MQGVSSAIEIKGLPLLKWPGGKRTLVKHILPLISSGFNCYYEPFLGGGALFFARQPGQACLSDINADLINCYIQIRDNPLEVIANLSELKNTEKDYYHIRSKVPADQIAQAARLIYLMTLSFNGIHRQNLRGEFNVPYGKKTYLSHCDTEKIMAASTALCNANLSCADFEVLLQEAGEGDIAYLDPPYTVAHNNNNFVKYNAKIFSWDDQIRLSLVANDLVKRGCRVIISNADHPSVAALYTGFEVLVIERSSVMAATNKYRRQITECIFYHKGS